MEFVKIGEIAQFINGMAFKPEDWSANGIKIIRIQNLTNPTKEFNRTTKMVPEKYYIHKGDVLVSWSATIDVFLWQDDAEAVLNQHIFKVIFDTQKVYKYYFIYALKETIYELSKLAHGSTMRHVVKSDFENHQIPLPSYENQIRISHLLEKIEATIAECKKTIDLLDELVKSIFYQMFGDPVRNEKRWKKDEIGKYADSIVPGRDKPKSFTGNIPWITTDKLNNLGHLEKDRFSHFLSLDEIQQAKSKIIPSGSILMTCVGDLGIVSVTKFPSVANQQLHSYQCQSELNNIFTMFCLSFLKSYMYKMASTTTVPYMNKTICNSIPIIIPPIDLQNQFAGIAQKIESIRAEQEVQLKDFEELYASVSQKVFTGDIDLSKVPFDASLLPDKPNPIETSEEEPNPDAVKQELLKEEIKKVSQPVTKRKLNWENVSFKEVANYIQNEFNGYYFNAEMLLRYLKEDIGMVVNYFSSVEQKKKPQYENADDFYRFITTAIIGENSFLELEQVFYNAETENIPNISFTETDLANMVKKDKKERSGIYFRIKDEITTP